MKLLWLAGVLLGLARAERASGQEPAPDFITGVQSSSDSGRSIGLHKLSGTERANLNALLNRAFQLGRNASASAPAAATPQVRNIQPGANGAASEKAYTTKIESNSGDVVRLENGAIVEVSSGYLGYLGYRKDAIFIQSGPRCRLWIEGKRTYRCSVLRPPTGRLAHDALLTSLTDVKGDGAVLFTSDGSVYEVSSIHTLYTALWLPASEVLILDSSQMVNLDQGDEVVDVVKVR